MLKYTYWIGGRHGLSVTASEGVSVEKCRRSHLLGAGVFADP